MIDERDLGQRVRAFAPEWREPTLLVGNRPIGRIGSRGRARGSVGAWGAPLLIADGQFNREPDRQLPLADAVTSRGVILDMNDDDFGGAALITLRQPVDLGEVKVFGIDRGGAVDDIRPTPTGERSWVIEACLQRTHWRSYTGTNGSGRGGGGPPDRPSRPKAPFT